MQNQLSAHQVSEFYHDHFVEDQVRHFTRLVPPDQALQSGVVVDVGGGVGFFARALQERLGVSTRVVDMDPVSVQRCREQGLDAEVGDALRPQRRGDESVACMNLMLHHLVAPSATATTELQVSALRAWPCRVFVNEYIYESYLGNLSGWLIYRITSSRLLSAIGRVVSKVVPSFRANTFGVGVRFRSHGEWRSLFNRAGFEVLGSEIGAPERVSPPLRLLLIKDIRRDSFLLRPRAAR